MKFDLSKVYSPVNADELQKGDIVITADNLHSLMIKVTEHSEVTIRPLEKIRPDRYVHRFHTIYGDSILAYLIERAHNCINCEGCVSCIKPDKTFVCKDWKPKTNRNLCDSCKQCFAECPATPDDIIFGDGVGNDNVYACDKYEKKAEPHYRPFKDTEELVKVWDAKYKEKYGLGRIDKGDKGLDMPYIWVRKKDCDSILLITGYNKPDCEVFIGDTIDLTQLFDNFTFLDSSPCGVEE